MEADWAVEIGPGLPMIEVPWEGFVDLRRGPDKLPAITEAIQSDPLRDALRILNEPHSPVFTAKCDRWRIEPSEIDPFEFEALPNDAQSGTASYIDVLQRSEANFVSFTFHEDAARRIVEELHSLPVRQGRVDLVIRAAMVDRREGYGITVYAAGCGADHTAADASWQMVLTQSVAATMRQPFPLQ